MFNILTSYNATAWETDQLMRMEAGRFGEYSGAEAEGIVVTNSLTLKPLEEIDTLLMYEEHSKSINVDIVRYGRLHEVKLVDSELVFKFEEKGRFSRAIVQEFADRLGIKEWEFNRTHWAVKDGGIPQAMLARLIRSFDVVFSFAGENREYVRKVAQYLRKNKVSIFFDENEQVHLWGKDLAEHFAMLYGQSGKYCVIFISKEYVAKNWTTLERRAAVSRALKEREEYILPARFDDTEVPGILPTLGYMSLIGKTPTKFGKLVFEKVRGPIVAPRLTRK